VLYLFDSAHQQLLGFSSTNLQLILQKKLSEKPFFTSLDWNPVLQTLVGICTGNGGWNWCQIDPSRQQPVIQRLFTIPELSQYGPTNCISALYPEENIYLFQPGFAAVEMSTIDGEALFTGGTNATILAYDSVTNRRFGVAATNDTNWAYMIMEIFRDKEPLTMAGRGQTAWRGKPSDGYGAQQVIAYLPPDLEISHVGLGAYDSQEHQWYIFMVSNSYPKDTPWPDTLIIFNTETKQMQRVPTPWIPTPPNGFFVTHMLLN